VLINTLDLFRGKKKLEKALQQSQHDIMSLTEKLLRVQNGKILALIFLFSICWISCVFSKSAFIENVIIHTETSSVRIILEWYCKAVGNFSVKHSEIYRNDPWLNSDAIILITTEKIIQNCFCTVLCSHDLHVGHNFCSHFLS